MYVRKLYEMRNISRNEIKQKYIFVDLIKIFDRDARASFARSHLLRPVYATNKAQLTASPKDGSLISPANALFVIIMTPHIASY